MRASHATAIAIALLGGCFSPDYGDGTLQCAAGGVCPPGLHCAADNRCYKQGSDPDLSVALDMAEPSDLESTDDGGADMIGRVRHQGQACGPGDVCDTSHCVDGFCCNSDCANSCQACNVAGNLGVCSDIGAGASPVGARSCNAQPMSSCGLDGKCDGAGQCRHWPSGTQCASGTCSAGNFTNPSTCNGAGTCVANPGGSCAPYVCQDSTQCFSNCTTIAQCSASNSCVNGSCGPLPNGRTCTSNGQCMSGFCVDGFCCNSACDTSSCQACDVPGAPGVCTTVGAGAPHGTRTCTNVGSSPCGGKCDGANPACQYAGTTTACGTACTSGQLQQRFCNSSGSCVPRTPTTCPGNYACPTGGSACLAMCSSNGDCFPTMTYGCNSGMQCKNYCVLDTDTLGDGCIVK